MVKGHGVQNNVWMEQVTDIITCMKLMYEQLVIIKTIQNLFSVYDSCTQTAIFFLCFDEAHVIQTWYFLGLQCVSFQLYLCGFHHRLSKES